MAHGFRSLSPWSLGFVILVRQNIMEESTWWRQSAHFMMVRRQTEKGMGQEQDILFHLCPQASTSSTRPHPLSFCHLPMAH